MTAQPFIPPSQHVDFIENGRRIGTMSVGGPILFIKCRKREVAFEMHNYFGAIPVDRRNGVELTRIPSGFWKAFEAWVKGGMLVDGDRCII